MRLEFITPAQPLQMRFRIDLCASYGNWMSLEFITSAQQMRYRIDLCAFYGNWMRLEFITSAQPPQMRFRIDLCIPHSSWMHLGFITPAQPPQCVSESIHVLLKVTGNYKIT
ncbi:hypothetical protein ILUMI_27266 [Ignelater luminosus]|uniref:Uncharacterized protein n=1 Tax=Ignelater luminosus TaxID=2038154 RepID=A0A8K0C5C9_IGNLU|nr:hypothetical protein ILUMI_27266 [Ignelater luminosus]